MNMTGKSCTLYTFRRRNRAIPVMVARIHADVISAEELFHDWPEKYVEGHPEQKLLGVGSIARIELDEARDQAHDKAHALSWINKKFKDFKESHWAAADVDEVKHFIAWLNEAHGRTGGK